MFLMYLWQWYQRSLQLNAKVSVTVNYLHQLISIYKCVILCFFRLSKISLFWFYLDLPRVYLLQYKRSRLIRAVCIFFFSLKNAKSSTKITLSRFSVPFSIFLGMSAIYATYRMGLKLSPCMSPFSCTILLEKLTPSDICIMFGFRMFAVTASHFPPALNWSASFFIK